MTDSEQLVFNFLVDFITRLGYSPTIREICAGVHLTNHTVHNHITRLADKGYIVRHEKIARGIVLAVA